jgi:hypothetical protein
MSKETYLEAYAIIPPEDTDTLYRAEAVKVKVIPYLYAKYQFYRIVGHMLVSC